MKPYHKLFGFFSHLLGRMGSCTGSMPKPVSAPPVPLNSTIAVVYQDKVAHLTTPLSPYTGALLAELSAALGLSPLETISGFLLEPEIGGPLCPLEMLHRLPHASTPVEAIVVKTCELKLGLGPLPYSLPIPQEDFNVNSDFVTAAADLGTPQSMELSNRLVQALLVQGFVRLSITHELLQVVEAAKTAAGEFWDVQATERMKAKSHLRDGKYLGFVSDGAREFVQMRLSDGGMQWPKGSEHQAKAFVCLFVLLHELSHKCIRLICQGLDLDVQYIMDMLDAPEHGSLLTSKNGPSMNRGDKWVGSDVFRVYRYFRPRGQPPPGLRNAATGLHCDMGLITLTPTSTSKGLSILNPDGTGWVDAEEGARPNHIFLFLGETLARLAADPFSLARKGKASDISLSPTASSPSNLAPSCPSPTVHSQAVATLLALHNAGRINDAALNTALAQLDKDPATREQKSQPRKVCLRAPMHFVDERITGVPRYSFPFFLRARPNSKICPDLSIAQFMENTVLSSRPWTHAKRTRIDY